MSKIEVAIVVRVTQANGDTDGSSVKRSFSFGDNPRWMDAASAEAVRQCASELAEALEKGAEPLNGTSSVPVMLS